MKFIRVIAIVVLLFMYQLVIFSGATQEFWLKAAVYFVTGFLLIFFAPPPGTVFRLGVRGSWLDTKQHRFEKFTTSDKSKKIYNLMLFVGILTAIVVTWIIPTGNSRNLFIAFEAGLFASGLLGTIRKESCFKCYE